MHHPKARKGFTLIEMAIVLVIVGLLAGLTLPVISDLIKREKSSAATSMLEQVREQIIGYALIYGYLPDDLQADLGIGDDPYGNTIQYRYATDLATDLCAETSTDFDVEYYTSASSHTTTNNVAFALFSIGRNMNKELPETNLGVAPTDNTAIGTGTLEYYDPRVGKSVLGITEEYDDSVLVVSLPLLQARVCTASADAATAPPGSDVSFANNLGDGESFVVQNAAQSAGKDAIRIDVDAGTMEMGASEEGNIYACQWYQGDLTGYCTDGVCDWGTGDGDTIRIYFDFTFKNADTSTASTQYEGGFTFTVMTRDSDGSGTNLNLVTDCGNYAANLGYAGVNTASTRLYAPKLGVEVDVGYNEGYNDPERSTTTLQQFNHVAIDYWDGVTGGNGGDVRHYRDPDNDSYLNANYGVQDVESADYNPGADNPGAGDHYCDQRTNARPVGLKDVGAGATNVTYGTERRPSRADPSSATSSNSTATDFDGDYGVIWGTAAHAAFSANNPTWLEDGNTHSMRIEIERVGTYSCGVAPIASQRTLVATHPQGTQYQIRVWIDDSSSGVNDLTQDGSALGLAGTYYTSQDLYLTEFLDFTQFLFGWTYGHDNNQETSVTFANFGINLDW